MFNARFRTAKLEDGEEVVRLVGGTRSRSGFPSDRPHAGMWGPDTGYLLIPSGSATNRRANIIASEAPSLKNRSGDAEVLFIGTVAEITRILESGPTFARARLKRPPSDASRLLSYRFPPAAQGPDAGASSPDSALGQSDSSETKYGAETAPSGACVKSATDGPQEAT